MERELGSDDKVGSALRCTVCVGGGQVVVLVWAHPPHVFEREGVLKTDMQCAVFC